MLCRDKTARVRSRRIVCVLGISAGMADVICSGKMPQTVFAKRRSAALRQYKTVTRKQLIAYAECAVNIPRRRSDAQRQKIRRIIAARIRTAMIRRSHRHIRISKTLCPDPCYRSAEIAVGNAGCSRAVARYKFSDYGHGISRSHVITHIIHKHGHAVGSYVQIAES